jgi:hypothetical protein
MTVTILAGAEPSTNNTDNNVRDMVKVALLEPMAAPLTVLLDKLGSQPARNPKVEWLENEALPRYTTLSASAASNATAFGVAADIFRAGDVIRFTATGFSILVSATAAGAVTAAKFGGQAQVSAASGVELAYVTNTSVEGATLREIKYPQLVTASNYCEIIQTPLGLTTTEQATEHYSGDERARLRNEAGIEHARTIDDTFWIGARDLANTNQRGCGGIITEFISTNVTNDSGGTTEAEWQTFLRSAFRYGSEEKIAFCSPAAISAIEGFARSNLRVVDSVGEKYGIKMQQYISGQGTVNIVMNRKWKDSTTLSGYCCVVDMDAVKMRPLNPTKLQADVHAPDYLGYKDRWVSELSLMVQHERRHALLTGMTGGN